MPQIVGGGATKKGPGAIRSRGRAFFYLLGTLVSVAGFAREAEARRPDIDLMRNSPTLNQRRHEDLQIPSSSFARQDEEAADHRFDVIQQLKLLQFVEPAGD